MRNVSEMATTISTTTTMRIEVAEPAGGRTQLAAQQCDQVARIALVDIRRRAAMRGMRLHLSITITAVAP